MNLLLDTNIVLDVLLNRAPWVNDSKAVWAACDKGTATGFITATTLTNIFYIAKRQADIQQARQAVRICLDTFIVCQVDSIVLEHAYLLAGKDFEDDLQIACATSEKLGAIITRNLADFQHASLPAYTPSDWLKQSTQNSAT